MYELGKYVTEQVYIMMTSNIIAMTNHIIYSVTSALIKSD
ncbi:transcriptional activator RinB [Staphylococcus aureus]